MRQRLVKQQAVDNIQSKKKYWDWNYLRHKGSESNSSQEHPQSNPDGLSESAAMYHVDDATKEIQVRVRKLVELAKQILTEQQYKVFFLLTNRGLKERAVAKLLAISQPRVHALWETARKKLEKAYVERTA